VPVVPEKPKGSDRKPVSKLSIEEVKEKIQGLRDKRESFWWATGSVFEEARKLDNPDEILSERDPTDGFLLITEKVSALKIDYEQARKDRERYLELRVRAEELSEDLKSVEALELLEKAYSPRGFRRSLINTVCQQLEGILNRYAKVLFPEDYTFTLELDKQFHIIGTRKDPKSDKVLTSDVRKLSGAESSLFSLLLWCGLMSFVPKAKRPNVVILDELDARLGPELTERFLAFLPRMLQIVEHVVVVTPMLSSRYEDHVPTCRYITVVKEGLSSKLMPGKATEQK
jgi:DNA repair exonuclease SbcCD ATPase subunit